MEKSRAFIEDGTEFYILFRQSSGSKGYSKKYVMNRKRRTHGKP
jgi:hypothetical protein